MPTNEELRLASMLYSLVNSGENIYNNKRGDGAQRYYCDVCDEENWHFPSTVSGHEDPVVEYVNIIREMKQYMEQIKYE
jgi:hypothetical protein